MKKLIIFLAAAVVAAGFNSCGTSDSLDAKAVAKEARKTAQGKVIDQERYDRLAAIYEKEHGDTAGFYKELNKILLKMGKDAPALKLEPVKAKKPIHVALYLDNTASMKGYIKPENKNVSTEGFARTLISLKNNYDGADDTVSCYYIDKKNLKAVTPTDLNELISSKNLTMGDAYSFDEFVGRIVDETLADSAHTRLNFFITDAIPSGTNEQIAKSPNRRYNIERRDVLEDNIREQLKRLRGDSYGVSVFRFYAAFDGKYPDYANASHSLHNATRPYYIIAIGDKYELQNLREDIIEKKIKGFEPKNSFHAISDVKAMRPVVRYNGKMLVADEDKNGVAQYSFEKKGDNETVKIDLPLSSLPEYLRDTDVAFNAFDITYQGKPFVPENTDFGKDKATFDLTLMSRNNNEVCVRVKNIYPGWIEESTSHDDSAIGDDPSQLGKTFNLDIVINGMVTGLFDRKGENLGEPACLNVKY